MARILRDRTEWPIVWVSYPSQPITDEDLELFLVESHEELVRGPHVAIHLSEGGSGLKASQRRRVAEWTLQHQELVSERCLGAAIVLRRPVLRAMVTAINWSAPPPYPQRLFAEEREARTWVESQLGQAGIPLPTPRKSATCR